MSIRRGKYMRVVLRNHLVRVLTVMITLVIPICAQGIASRYSGDKNIHLDSNVIFTEMGEENDLNELFGRWTTNSSSNSIALDSTAFPPGSPGKQSIRLFTTAGQLGQPGTHRTAMLYKLLSPGINDSLFMRWYVRYNTSRTFHHSGPRIGGSYPPSSIPNVPAGQLPNDSTDQFFYSGAEVTGARVNGVPFSTFDFYNYWQHQRHSSFFADSLYYGNSFINSPSVGIEMSSWNCIEMRVKLNTPGDSTGEISLWINGIPVSHVARGTTGNWTDDDFFPGTGPPFEGFEWRKNAQLNINFLWLLHFSDHDAAGEINSVNYDHIVAAKSYIGPISSVTGVQRSSSPPAEYRLEQNFPNPFNPATTIEYSLPEHHPGSNTRDGVSLKVYDILGNEISTLVNEQQPPGNYSVRFNASSLSSGIYFYRLTSGLRSITKKMTVLR